MEIFLEIIKILLPALVVFFTAYYSIKLLTKNEQEKKSIEAKSSSQKDIIMLRLQAYERFILLLDRITPNNLIMRLAQNQKNVNDLHIILLTDIRAEFDHNISQQLYISHDAWKVIKETKEDIVKIINIAKENLSKDATLMDFTRAIIEADLQNNSPTIRATDFIKNEALTIF